MVVVVISGFAPVSMAASLPSLDPPHRRRYHRAGLRQRCDMGLQRLDVVDPGDLVAALGERREAVAAVGEEGVDRHPVVGRRVDRSPVEPHRGRFDP